MTEEVRDEIYAGTTTVAAIGTVVKRISWGAVFAGLAVALVIQITLSILGIGIGLSTVNFENNNPGIGEVVRNSAAIWLVFTALVSLYVGGCVAGRLAGLPRRQDALLHG